MKDKKKRESLRGERNAKRSKSVSHRAPRQTHVQDRHQLLQRPRLDAALLAQRHGAALGCLQLYFILAEGVARRVATTEPGRHGDGRGLMLFVKPSGSRSWVLRYQRQGRRRDMGLGAYPEVSLAEARAKALEARRQILQGHDPLAERARTVGLTFKNAAEALIEAKRPGWRNAKHAAQ